MSRSSTEVEYKSVAAATAEIMWIQSLLDELQVNINTKPIIWCDNLSAVSLAANSILHARTKHIEIDLYFVHEQVLKGKLQVHHVPSAYQRAYILTKALSNKNFTRLRTDLKIQERKSNNLNSS